MVTTLLNRARGLLSHLASSPSQSHTWVPIKPDHVAPADGRLATPFRPGGDYFQVRVNRMQLANKREWFTRYDPVVLLVTEFSYTGQIAVAPFLVGPSMLQQFGQAVPDGMVFVNTAVAGPHPYRGGDIALSVILYRLDRGSYAREFLDIVQNTAKVLDFGLPVQSYTQVASVVLDGIEALTGTADSQAPLIGRRTAFGPAQSGYFALIDAPDASIDEDMLWVRDSNLLYGSSADAAAPIRGVDYVLYSLTHVDRDDLTVLPFFPMWRRVLEEVTKSSTDDVWLSAKVNMAALLGSVYTSPDLTEPHAERVAQEWTDTLDTLHKRAVGLAKLSQGYAPEKSSLDGVRGKANAVLKM